MDIIKVGLGRTYNIGNFESLRIDLEASIDEKKESVQDVLKELDIECRQYLDSVKV